MGGSNQPVTWSPVETKPLTPSEKEALRERFRKVILLAGYKDPEPILNEWFEELFNKDLPGFIRMLEDYEKHKGDPL